MPLVLQGPSKRCSPALSRLVLNLTDGFNKHERRTSIDLILTVYGIKGIYTSMNYARHRNHDFAVYPCQQSGHLWLMACWRSTWKAARLRHDLLMSGDGVSARSGRKQKARFARAFFFLPQCEKQGQRAPGLYSMVWNCCPVSMST